MFQPSRLPLAALVLAAFVGLFALPAVAQSPPPAATTADQGGQAAQQEKPAGQFGEEVQVDEVLLDVLVTDKKGNVIIGLKPDDFVVEEDGKPVELTGLTFYSNSRFVEPAGAARAKGISVDRVPEDRYFILFFHDQRQQGSSLLNNGPQQLEAARQARRWVRESLLPSDWVAVASYDYKLKLHQDFTHDKGAVIRAIDDAIAGKDPSFKDWPSRTHEVAGEPSLRASLPRGKELRQETGTLYDGIRLLADAAGPVVGRKNLLLFSSGFGEVNSFGQYKPDHRYYPEMMQALNDNNVAVYGIDMTPAGVDNQMVNSLTHLALDTGGRSYTNFNNFIVPLEQVTDENSGYYLLSYRSRHPAGESGFQEVEVKAKNPEFRVRARSGYAYGSKGTSG